MPTLKDLLGDPVTIENDGYGEVSISVTDRDRSAQAVFTADGAAEVARAILAEADAAEGGAGAPTTVVGALNRIAAALEAQNEPEPQTVTIEDVPGATESEPQTATIEDLRYGSTITFTYQGEHDDYPRQRRIVVDDVDPYNEPARVYGRDLDAEGCHRTFREDRIKSPIMVAAEGSY